MKLYYFGQKQHGTYFAIVPAESKEETIEKLKEAREKELEDVYAEYPFYKNYKEENRPYFGLENYLCEEIKNGVYFDNHD